VKLIITADWHLGAGLPKAWGRHADARRTERTAAILQIIEYARTSGAQYLLVAGDIADCPEPVPDAIVNELASLSADTGGRCRPVLFFTSADHDRQRAWWSGDMLTSAESADRALKPCQGQPPFRPTSSSLQTDYVFISVHEALPRDVVKIDVPAGLPWVALVHRRHLNGGALKDLAARATFVACGDRHDQEELTPGRAWYVGSPTFRDLSSFDEGPRGFLDVDISKDHEVRVTPKSIVTPLSATVAVSRRGAVRCTPPVEPPTTDPIEAAKNLLRRHRYVRIRTIKEGVSALQARCRQIEDVDVIRWPGRGRTATVLLVGPPVESANASDDRNGEDPQIRQA
jgi:hypothetical protein